MSERISIVVPCFNEAGNIAGLVEGLLTTIDALHRDGEIVLVDDGSADGTWDAICQAAKRDARVRGIRQMRNYGQSLAYQAGIDRANGDLLVLFSGDCETDFVNIEKVIKKLDEGWDFVNTRRIHRWRGERRAYTSNFGNAIINRISGLTILDRGSGLKGMRMSLGRSLRFYGEMHRFIPDYASLHTTRITEIDTDFRERSYGQSAYRGTLRSISVFLDLISLAFFLHSARRPFPFLPGRVFGFTGLIIGAAGFSVSGWLAIEKLIWGATLSNRPLFLVSILTTSLGIVMTMLGVMGEMLMRVYYETGKRESYLARQDTKDKEFQRPVCRDGAPDGQDR